MLIVVLLIAVVLLITLLVVAIRFARWGARWGATVEECAARMPGDDYFNDGPPHFVAMTRAISIAAPAESVWPWLAQLGRGAGFYSYDRLDNGGKMSARHVVSWIPPPALGDSGPIGYLSWIEPPTALTWWAPGAGFLGARARLAIDMQLRRENSGSRLVIRISADTVGRTAWLAISIFKIIDTIMARRQLLGIKERAERYRVRSHDPEHPETGERDQYQFYEVIYASGEQAGVPSKEQAAMWRREAAKAGLIPVGASVRGESDER